ncbi:hypothetical protein BTA51_12470 [Hahella sp. CCB-MM4]|uniref:hypothetical protein n=1 Tax=Hahella sp. (strain CCB-MM4) TaxID=1926491 RepID=UPI000B9C2CD8|nr:hypothetical protein [Hahella sp. CCB-MM4]OZG73284.1 hypothetical protein BTA51_12470 [Hahella sp. CCB-MM4]
MAKHLYNSALIVTVLFTLAACGGQESNIPERQTLTPPVGSTGSSANDLSGRVIDGYLRYARVWLDVNENYQLDAGEPRVMSGEGGKFTFTTEMMGGLGSPRKYRIMAHILPGISVDEDYMTGNNEAPGLVDDGYILAAPPGTTSVTPLTTLVVGQYDYLKRRDGTTTYGKAHNTVRARLNYTSLDLLQDYVAKNDYDLRALAKSLVAAQKEFYSDQNHSVVNNLLDQIDSDTAAMMTSYLLSSSTGILQLSQTWVDSLDLSSPSQIALQDFSDFRSMVATSYAQKPDLSNPEILFERRWYISANSTSLQQNDTFLNDAYYFPIFSDTTIASDFSAPDISELLQNTKMVGRAQFSRLMTGSVRTVRLDGGVDFHGLYRAIDIPGDNFGQYYVKASATHDLYTTESLESDGQWDLITSAVIIDLDASEDTVNPATVAVHRLPDGGSMTELTSLYVNAEEDSSTVLGLNTDTRTSATVNVDSTSTVQFQLAAEFNTDYQPIFFGQSSSYDNRYEYGCYNSGELESVRIFSTNQGDDTTACAATPDLGFIQIFPQDDLPSVECRTHIKIPGQHLCEFTLLDGEGRPAIILTRRRQGAIVENLDPNDGDLVLVEERIYAPLADSLEEEFITVTTDTDSDINANAPPSVGNNFISYPTILP